MLPNFRIKSSAASVTDPWYILKEVHCEDQQEALCALGKLAGEFHEPSFLHLPILRGALKPFTKISPP